MLLMKSKIYIFFCEKQNLYFFLQKAKSINIKVLCFVHPKEMRDFKEVNGKKEFNIYSIYPKYNLFEIFTHGLINVITSIKK